MADLQGGIGDVERRVSVLRTKLSDAAGTINLGITLGAIASIRWLRDTRRAGQPTRWAGRRLG
jgi:hypothetical protein